MNSRPHPTQPEPHPSARTDDTKPVRSRRSILHAKAIVGLLLAVVAVAAFATASAAHDTHHARSTATKVTNACAAQLLTTPPAAATNVELDTTLTWDQAVARELFLDGITELNQLVYADLMTSLTNQGYPFIP